MTHSGTSDTLWTTTNVVDPKPLTEEMLRKQIEWLEESAKSMLARPRVWVVSKAEFDLGVKLGAIDKEGNFL